MIRASLRAGDVDHRDALVAAERHVDVLAVGREHGPIGRGGTLVPSACGILIVVTTLCAWPSITVTAAAFSSVTNAVAPSGVNTTERGRAAVFIFARTFKLRGVDGVDFVVFLARHVHHLAVRTDA